jgi:hypothetical protein
MSFPVGKLWARYVPNVTIFGVELNPGPFTIKEHVIITIMSTAADGPAYAVCTSFAVNLSISQAIFRPTLSLFRSCSTIEILALLVSCGRSELQDIGLNYFTE